MQPLGTGQPAEVKPVCGKHCTTRTELMGIFACNVTHTHHIALCGFPESHSLTAGSSRVHRNTVRHKGRRMTPLSHIQHICSSKDADDVFGDHSAARFTTQQRAAAVPRLTASSVSVCCMESDLTSLLSTLLQLV